MSLKYLRTHQLAPLFSRELKLKTQILQEILWKSPVYIVYRLVDTYKVILELL